MKDCGDAIAVCFVGVIIGFFIGATVSSCQWKGNLVKEGHAEWVSNKHGHPHFRLKEMK